MAMAITMNQIIELEDYTGLGATQAALLLGVAYPTYAQYKSGRREIQRYHLNHIQALLLLPRKSLNQLIGEHVHGN